MKIHGKKNWKALCCKWPLFEDYTVNGIKWSNKKHKITCKKCIKLFTE